MCVFFRPVHVRRTLPSLLSHLSALSLRLPNVTWAVVVAVIVSSKRQSQH